MAQQNGSSNGGNFGDSTADYESKIQEWESFCDQNGFMDGYIVAPDKAADFLQDKILNPTSRNGKRKPSNRDNPPNANAKGKGREKRSRLESNGNDDLISQLVYVSDHQDIHVEGEEDDLELGHQNAVDRVNSYLSAITHLWRTQVRLGTNKYLNPKNGPVEAVIENARAQDEGRTQDGGRTIAGRGGLLDRIANGSSNGHARMESLQTEMNQRTNELRNLTQQPNVLPIVAAMAEMLVQYVNTTQQALSYLAASDSNQRSASPVRSIEENHHFQSNPPFTNDDLTTASAIASISNSESSSYPTPQANLNQMGQYSAGPSNHFQAPSSSNNFQAPSSSNNFQASSSKHFQNSSSSNHFQNSSSSNAAASTSTPTFTSSNIPTGRMTNPLTQIPPGPIPPSGEFRMVRGLTTITEAFKEWKHGLHGHPSIEEKYINGTDNAWKRENKGKRGAEVRFFQRRRNLIDFVENMAKENGVTGQEVANKLEAYRSAHSISLNKLTDEGKCGNITWELIRNQPEAVTNADSNS